MLRRRRTSSFFVAFLTSSAVYSSSKGFSKERVALSSLASSSASSADGSSTTTSSPSPSPITATSRSSSTATSSFTVSNVPLDDPMNSCRIRASTPETALPRSCLSPICKASSRSAPKAASMASSSSDGNKCRVSSFFFLPAAAANSLMASQMTPIAVCPIVSASAITSSGRKSASPSIIRIPSLLPAMIRLSVLFSCSCFVGFTFRMPSTSPTSTPAIGFSIGTVDTAMAAEAAQILSASSGCVRS
mmetsp:Transcript_44821/g.74381  ORF Transcript_44821/g.74381 Transcript_44821/m.74381 type:complete len:247 (+) Transcript_44821:1494-2234(+)